MRNDPLLSVSNLQTYFEIEEGILKAVDGVSFRVDAGETVALVGESGSGKTVTTESITRLFKQPPGYIAGGEILFDGNEVTELSETELRSLRGNRISHIFQNPQGALNPVYTIGWQIQEALTLHQNLSETAAAERAIELLDRVGLPEASSKVEAYPHELSGGQKQRVMIAIALACDPDLLIADEPTTALDVTIQAQILRLLNELQAEREMAVLFVTHDLGVVTEIADRVIVMYAGKIMEQGSIAAVFQNPAHPYTRALLACLPGNGNRDGIPGTMPDAENPPDGCRFADRCEHAISECRSGDQPPLYPVEEGTDHLASCVHFAPTMDSSVILDEDGGSNR